MLKEFKIFIAQGNVLDLAVGIIIGAAFGKITTSLVDDIIMPLIGMAMGGIDLATLSIKVGSAVLKYGNFIQTVIDFLLVAWVVFMIVRVYNKSGFAKKSE